MRVAGAIAGLGLIGGCALVYPYDGYERDQGGADAALSLDAGPEPTDCTDVDLLTDVNNCGACGHDCLGGACESGQCQPSRFFTNPTSGGGQGTLGEVVLQGDYLYLADIGQVQAG